MQRVHVDATRCQGHARCYGLVPDVFDLDDQGHGITKVELVPAGLEDAVYQAVVNCPERAISTSDD